MLASEVLEYLAHTQPTSSAETGTGVRERHLESIIQSTIRHIILVQNHPRTLIQVTLQVTATPHSDSAFGKLPQAASVRALPPRLLKQHLIALSEPTHIACTTPNHNIGTSLHLLTFVHDTIIYDCCRYEHEGHHSGPIPPTVTESCISPRVGVLFSARFVGG